MRRAAYSRASRGRFPPVVIATLLVGSLAAAMQIWTDSSIEFIRASVVILTVVMALWSQTARKHRSVNLEERLNFEGKTRATPGGES